MLNGNISIIMLLKLILSGRFNLKAELDKAGLSAITQMMQDDFNLSKPGEFLNFMQNIRSFHPATPPDFSQFHFEELRHWKLAHHHLNQQKLTFPSFFRKSNDPEDRAVFYLYSKGSLKGKKMVLWIPGFTVSDFFFPFIKKWFNIALDHDYNVLFYNIPCHLERILRGKHNGEGLFTASAIGNIETIYNSLLEINSALAYFKKQGVASFSGWGCSVGGTLLLLASTYEMFDHMALTIPIVDWNTILFNPYLKKVIKANIKTGYSKGMIDFTYSLISPIHYRSLVDPARIQLLYGQYDQLSPEKTILKFARSWKIKNVHSYPDSHGSIVFNKNLFQDYSCFLDTLT